MFAFLFFTLVVARSKGPCYNDPCVLVPDCDQRDNTYSKRSCTIKSSQQSGICCSHPINNIENKCGHGDHTGYCYYPYKNNSMPNHYTIIEDIHDNSTYCSEGLVCIDTTYNRVEYAGMIVIGMFLICGCCMCCKYNKK